MGKRPAFQFYPGDWLREPALRGVSVAARGLWIDILCLMFECDRKGYLMLGGKPPTLEQIARMTGCSTEDASRLVSELEASGAFSRTEHGVIFSRRMVRDESKRLKCSEAGRKGGGNPTLKGQQTLIGDCKGGDKGAPKRNPKASSSSSSSASTSVEEDPPSPLRLSSLEFLEAWNAASALTPCRSLTSGRLKHLRARAGDPIWLASWREAIARAALSPFCRGENDRGWRATVDWFLKPDTVAKILEGTYDARRNGAPQKHMFEDFDRGFKSQEKQP